MAIRADVPLGSCDEDVYYEEDKDLVNIHPPKVEYPAERYTRDERARWYGDFALLVRAMPQLKDIAARLPADLSDLGEWSKFDRGLLFQCAGLSNWDTSVARTIDFWQANFMGLPEMVARKPADPEHAEKLAVEGWSPLPSWPQASVDALRTVIGGLPALETETKAEKPAEALRAAGQNVAHIHPDRLTDRPEVLAVVTDTDMLDMVMTHLRAWPTLINLSAWWSFATSTEARNAQLYHFDQDDYRFCKVFLYLTDVDLDSGPHQFVPRTQDQDFMEGRRARLADDPETQAAFDNWYFPQLRKTEEEVERFIGIEPISITGPAGTRMIVNTRGIHRGLRPTARDRLLLQATFGISQRFQDKATPASLDDVMRDAPLDTGFADLRAWRHMLRFYWT